MVFSPLLIMGLEEDLDSGFRGAAHDVNFFEVFPVKRPVSPGKHDGRRSVNDIYPCRHPHCSEMFGNYKSRLDHERRVHPEMVSKSRRTAVDQPYSTEKENNQPTGASSSPMQRSRITAHIHREKPS